MALETQLRDFEFVEKVTSFPAQFTGRYVVYAGSIVFQHMTVRFELRENNYLHYEHRWHVEATVGGRVVYENRIDDLTYRAIVEEVRRASLVKAPGYFVSFTVPGRR